jgi:hypothetical protein
MGLPTPVTIPNLKNIPWRYCSRWNEQPAAHLGNSLLRLGICRSEDWSGSAVDFVERGFKRFCRAHCSSSASIWTVNLQITDHQFDLPEQQRQAAQAEMSSPAHSLYLMADYGDTTSIPVGAVLQQLEREDEFLPAAFMRVFLDNLEKWMPVYDYETALNHAEYWMEGMEEENLQEAIYPKIKQNVPGSLSSFKDVSHDAALGFLTTIAPNLRSHRLRQLAGCVLEMHDHGKGHEHAWPYQLEERVPGLDDFLNDADGCIPGAVVPWYEGDEIIACLDEEVNEMGQNGFLEPSTMVWLPLSGSSEEVDKGVKLAFNHAAAMLESLSSAAKAIEIMWEINNDYVRKHRVQSGVPVKPGAADVRQEQL